MQQELVTSNVIEARIAAYAAVGRCDTARIAADQKAASVVAAAGNDVAHRDAAALEALDASRHCVTASVEARKAADRFVAVARPGDQSSAAEHARAAAARCADAGAISACRAANAFADSCIAVCGHAAALTEAAREAAACCVRARDDAVTAKLVAQQVAAQNVIQRWALAPENELAVALVSICYRDVAHENAAQDSSDRHKKARKGAVAAALAARKAALRCATASRHALAAALVAREAASADGDGAAATEATQAANRCVAAGADVPEPDPVVPSANRAAVEAREAATSCDAALANPIADANKEYLDKMRGWLMTVAALFVGIAFQAILHPPDGMSFDDCNMLRKALPRVPSVRSCIYLYTNTCTMAIALTGLVLLLTIKKATDGLTLYYIQGMAALAITVASSFISGASKNYGVHQSIFLVLLTYTVTFIFGHSFIQSYRRYRSHYRSD